MSNVDVYNNQYKQLAEQLGGTINYDTTYPEELAPKNGMCILGLSGNRWCICYWDVDSWRLKVGPQGDAGKMLIQRWRPLPPALPEKVDYWIEG